MINESRQVALNRSNFVALENGLQLLLDEPCTRTTANANLHTRELRGQCEGCEH